MGLWVELGIFGVALAFGLWQLWDVKKAREQSRRMRPPPPPQPPAARPPGDADAP
jgi:hypothetical protein